MIYTITKKTAGLVSLTPSTRKVSLKRSLMQKLAVRIVLDTSLLTEGWVEGKTVIEKSAQVIIRGTKPF